MGKLDLFPHSVWSSARQTTKIFVLVVVLLACWFSSRLLFTPDPSCSACLCRSAVLQGVHPQSLVQDLDDRPLVGRPKLFRCGSLLVVSSSCSRRSPPPISIARPLPFSCRVWLSRTMKARCPPCSVQLKAQHWQLPVWKVPVLASVVRVSKDWVFSILRGVLEAFEVSFAGFVPHLAVPPELVVHEVPVVPHQVLLHQVLLLLLWQVVLLESHRCNPDVGSSTSPWPEVGQVE